MSVSQINLQSIEAPSIVLTQNSPKQLPKTDSLCERCMSCFTFASTYFNSYTENKTLQRGASKEDLLSVQISELNSSVATAVKKEGSPLQRHRRSPVSYPHFNPEPPFYGYPGFHFVR